MFLTSSLWKGRKHYLDKMTLAELVRAYFAFPTIQLYIVLGLVAAGLTAYWFETPWGVLLAAVATPIVYAPTWYLLHRFVLHGRYLYRSSLTAPLWKRIHFDHHQDPNDLGVLFGAPYTTLPTILAVTIPVGWLFAGPSGSAAAFAMGMLTTCFYEFCHCIQHLAYTPKWQFIRRIKRLHLLHHFHNEQGNYGITSFVWDRAARTFYDSAKRRPRSATVFNLGYDNAESERFPWVRELSGGSFPQRS